MVTLSIWSLLTLFVYGVFCKSTTKLTEDREYCIVGAGPAGLQLAYYFEQSHRDYIILERHDSPGWFFQVYPRHRTLISINKRYTGSNNTEFNMRHDWNSLLSHDPNLLFTKYSKRYYPEADRYVTYLRDFAKRFNIKIRFNTDITSISRRPPLSFQQTDNAKSGTSSSDKQPFFLTDSKGLLHRCQIAIVATGAWQPNIPGFVGIEHAIGYENISTNPDDYEGKSVLILGKGNSAFETANAIFEGAAYVQLISAGRIRLSWATHYVGDIRGVNNMFLDNYQLKSLDAVSEADPTVMAIRKRPEGYYLHPPDSVDRGTKLPTEGRLANQLGEVDNGTSTNLFLLSDNFGFRKPFDMVIRCLGFHFDRTIFPGDTRPRMVGFAHGKYPEINAEYESVNIPGLHFMGTIAHSLDWRKASGGFIHGFRYSIRTFYRQLENKRHRKAWPHVTIGVWEILKRILDRINESAGLYQMFSHLVDVVLLPGARTKAQASAMPEDNVDVDIDLPDIDTTGFGLSKPDETAQVSAPSSASPVNAPGANNFNAVYLEEVPLSIMLGRTGWFQEVTGIPIGDHFLTVEFRYGENYSGPNKDVFAPDRVITDPARAHMCNFLHPVISYYHSFNRIKPVAVHHILEDLLTDWTAPEAHIKPLGNFLEKWVQPKSPARESP